MQRPDQRARVALHTAACPVFVERVEGDRARGTARGYAPVRFAHAGARRGEVVWVRVTGSDGAGCHGEREGAQVST